MPHSDELDDDEDEVLVLVCDGEWPSDIPDENEPEEGGDDGSSS